MRIYYFTAGVRLNKLSIYCQARLKIASTLDFILVIACQKVLLLLRQLETILRGPPLGVVIVSLARQVQETGSGAHTSTRDRQDGGDGDAPAAGGNSLERAWGLG